MQPDLKIQIQTALKKSISHLQTSLLKVRKIDLDKAGELSEQDLEVLESFSSRFARSSDIAVSKYFRLLALEGDPGFRGTVIDLLNLAEKYSWISSAKTWQRIREIRNIAAHDYAEDELRLLYKEIVTLAPAVIEVAKKL
mgnify:CR=1 FL=1